MQELKQEHTKKLEKMARKIDKEVKLQEYADKVKDLLQRFVDQVINPMLKKLQAEKGAEIEAVIQWKKDSEKEKAKYHAYLAALADDLLAGKFSTINAMAKLFGMGVKDVMSQKYFENIAKDRRDRFLKQHMSEIEKSFNKGLKLIITKMEN